MTSNKKIEWKKHEIHSVIEEINTEQRMYDRAPLLMSQLNTEEWEPTQKRGEKYHHSRQSREGG